VPVLQLYKLLTSYCSVRLPTSAPSPTLNAS